MILSISRNIIINPKAYLKVSRLILQWLCENKSMYLSTSLSIYSNTLFGLQCYQKEKKKKGVCVSTARENCHFIITSSRNKTVQANVSS